MSTNNNWAHGLGRSTVAFWGLGVAGAAWASAAVAQTPACPPSWVPTFGATQGTDERVRAMVVFDDGSGPALFVGGALLTAGSTSANYIAKWDGTEFSALGDGLNGQVFAMAVYDDGSGPALYVGGGFNVAGGIAATGVAKWDGSQWSGVGAGPGGMGVLALAVYDAGSGPELYAGGVFQTPSGAFCLAKWNGTTWSDVGNGVEGDSVNALAVYDDGSGPRLYVAGDFPTIDGIEVDHIAAWNGASWTGLGYGVLGAPSCMTVFDDGSGSALYVGTTGSPQNGPNSPGIARWNGSWSAVGAGLSSSPSNLTVFDDGAGPQLYANGNFGVRRWNGSNWSSFGADFNSSTHLSMAVFDDGNGAALYFGGYFHWVNGIVARCLARWDGATWSSVGPDGPAATVTSLAAFDPGGGELLYAAGNLTAANGQPANGIASWDGTQWSALSSGLTHIYGPGDVKVEALFPHDDGSGEKLFVGGNFYTAGGLPAKHIATWDGSAWSALPGDFNGQVRAFAEFDDGSGSALYVAGWFTDIGGVAISRVARWDGAQWSALGSGLGVSWQFQYARALTTFDDGSGPALYAAGDFTTAGGLPAQRIARWNGSQWSAVGGGLNGSATSLAVFDDGNGEALYAGGYFTSAGGVPVQSVARWDGSQWSAIPMGPVTIYGATFLAPYDDGSGPALYVGASFQNVGSAPTTGLARWNGSAWSGFGGGLNNLAFAVATYDDGACPGRSLYVGGAFTSARDCGDSYIARWSCPPQACNSGLSYCTAGTTSGGCVPSISGSGTASASATSGFTLSVVQLDGQRSGHLFYGVNGPNAAPWGPISSSFLCVKAPTQRMGTQSSGGTFGQCDGAFVQDWNAFRATHPTALGQPFAVGATVWSQAWFRDPPAPKTTSLSNALQFTLAP